jgi:hypothetical protein
MVAVVAITLVVVLAALLGYSRGLSAAQSTYPLVSSTVLTGNDIGFRLISPDSPEGVLVVRIGGKWVAAESARAPRLLK